MSKRVKITDLIDFNPTRNLKRGNNAPFVEMAALPESSRDIAYVSKREFKGGGAKFQNGDTLFARITPCLENGKTAKVNILPDGVIGHGSTEFIVMAAKLPDIDEDYVYYLAWLPAFREFAKNRMEGTSGRQRVSWQALSEYETEVPSPEIRKAAGRFLRTLDDKIQLNQQINQTLEKMAQAIFKSWFVDFEPTRAKIIAKEQGADPATQELAAQAIICGAITLEQLAEVEQNLETTLQQAIDEKLNQHKQTNPTALNAQQLKTTAALFPNELVELKEAGLAQQYNIIPEGWSVNSIFDIAEVIYGAPFKSKLFNTDGDGLPLVRIRDLKQERPGVSTPEVHPRGYLIQNGDLLVGMDGEFRPYIWGGHKAWMNQRVCTFKPKRNLSAALIREFISAQLRFFELTAVATTVIHLGKGDIDGFTYLEPNNELLNICSDVLEPIFQKIVSNKVECISLEELRDTLLPKLLSGELSVSAAADQITKAEEAVNVQS